MLLLFTSGTTGRAKAVKCSQGRLAGIGRHVSAQWDITRDDVSYCCMPLFHGNARMSLWAPTLAVGGCIALPTRFSASRFLDDVRTFGATFFTYVGKAVAYVLATPERPDDADNQLARGFGTEASPDDRDAFQRRFGCRLFEGYGSSEGAGLVGPDPAAPTRRSARSSASKPRSGSRPTTSTRTPMPSGPATGGTGPATSATSTPTGSSTSPAARATGSGSTARTCPRYRSSWCCGGTPTSCSPPRSRCPTPDPAMAAIELRDGAVFDPDEFAAFVAAQADLAPKAAPRLVRISPALPTTGSNKLVKQPMRAERWHGPDPVYRWAGRGEPTYVPMSPADRGALDDEIIASGRAHLLR